MTALLRDLRVAVRVLLNTKSWTLIVLLSLALGIGANTALFTAVNGLLLQTVRVREPERLIRFNWTGENDMVRSSSDYGYSGSTGTRNVRSTFSFAIFEQLRAATEAAPTVPLRGAYDDLGPFASLGGGDACRRGRLRRSVAAARRRHLDLDARLRPRLDNERPGRKVDPERSAARCLERVHVRLSHGAREAGRREEPHRGCRRAVEDAAARRLPDHEGRTARTRTW